VYGGGRLKRARTQSYDESKRFNIEKNCWSREKVVLGLAEGERAFVRLEGGIRNIIWNG